MKIHSNSSWPREKILHYLDNTCTPLRISAVDRDGYPIVCSLWFIHDNGTLWAASHKNSHTIKVLENNCRVGFEIANNDYPYHGVRGKADVTLIEHDKEKILEKVIDKYLQGSNQSLANWLLSREHDEYSIQITPRIINSWDFGDRMEVKNN